MWFRGRATRNDATMVATPPSSSIDDNKANVSNKHQSSAAPSSRKTKRSNQRRQVSVTPAEHAAILRERQKLKEARQRRHQHEKNKQNRPTVERRTPQKRSSHHNNNRSRIATRTTFTSSRVVVGLFFAIGFSLPLLLLLYRPRPTSFQLRKSNTQHKKEENTTPVHFIQAGIHVNDEDLSSASSWLQPLSSFSDFDTSGTNLDTKQAGSNALFQANRHKVQMTLDWLDFSVQRLSSWIEATETLTDSDNVAFHVLLSKLYEYMKHIWMDDTTSAMQDTIAVIAFEPWTSRIKPHAAYQLSVASLAATVASLIQASFVRVVVVGYNVQDEEYANESFQLLLSLIPNQDTTSGNTTTTARQSVADKIHKTELAYVRAETRDVISLKTPINIVKGALTGLQAVFKGDTSMSTERRFEWLGTTRNVSSWKYVYLTELDSILQTKPSSLPFLKIALDQGMILAPHELQPLPHEHDLAGMKNTNKRVPNSFANDSMILQLAPFSGAVCCDEYSRDDKPWKQYPKCESHWWQCGFDNQQNHSRLEPYTLIRLTNPGLNLVSLAGTHNGRRCLPSSSGTCKAK